MYVAYIYHVRFFSCRETWAADVMFVQAHAGKATWFKIFRKILYAYAKCKDPCDPNIMNSTGPGKLCETSAQFSAYHYFVHCNLFNIQKMGAW